MRAMPVLYAFMFVSPLCVADGLPDQPFVEVVGEGKVSVQPDGIKVDFDVIGHGDTGAAAREDADRKLMAVADILEELGLPDDALESHSLDVGEEWDYSEAGKRKSLGWDAERSSTLDIRDLERAPEILARMMEGSVEYWNDISPYVDDREAIEKQLRAAAFADAVRRAEEYTELAGLELGRVWRMGDYKSRTSGYQGEITVQGARIRQKNVLPVIEIHEFEITQELRVIFLLD